MIVLLSALYKEFLEINMEKTAHQKSNRKVNSKYESTATEDKM